jgi:hypothetical protein
MTIIDLVTLLDRDARVVERNTDDPCIDWVLVDLNDSRRVLFVERTYWEGSTMIVNPSDEEIAGFRRDPWTAWNSPRGEDVGGL